ncbi:DUF917 domain-containing protein [Patulibacter medicamentivorans]|jgi:DUF917 family protein|uniref:DUF917 domain-containing protein n=1 Tax=Patulibacter medicamentivorans TaxID=1097667 RepID=UPI00058DFD3F|nr:DUF917 domain-containing protein [Patulibacter medicamentivorans]
MSADIRPTLLATAVDVEDFVAGTNLLSGAGGAPNEALEHLGETLAEGYEIGWHDLDVLDDDDLVVAAWYSGSVDPDVWRERDRREAEFGLERRVRRPLVAAIEQLEDRLGRRAAAVMPIEIGASNTAAALDAGTRLGRIVPDVDCAGRAIPAFDCTLAAVAGLVRPPLALVDYYGDVVEVVEAANVGRLEAIAKMVAAATLGRVGSAGLAMSASEAKRHLPRGTLSASLAAGRALRAARAEGGDVVAGLVARLDGAMALFGGELVRTEWDNATGYMVGHHHIRGTGDWAGKAMRIFFQNENHLAWIDGRPVAMSPDLIEMVDARSAEPLVNTFLDVGQELAVLGIPRRPELASPGGIAAIGPARWGFDLPYAPFQDLCGDSLRP